MPRLLILIVLIIALTAGAAYAGWSEDIKLEFGSNNFQPEIIARGDTVHVTSAQIAPTDSIFYMRGLDAGNQWDQAISLQDSGHKCDSPGLCLSRDRLLVSWYDIDTNPENSPRNIGFSTSIGGGGWSLAGYVFDAVRGGNFEDFSLVIIGDTVYAIYGSNHSDSTGYRPLKFLRSTDLGQSWSGEITLRYLYAYTNPLQIVNCGGSLYIIWSGNAPPEHLGWEVNGMVSFDGGRNWSDHFFISSPDPYVAQHSCVACDEETGYLAVGWMDFALSHGYPGDIFVRVTTDGGRNWGEIQYATTHHQASNPSLAIKGDSIYAVWSDLDPSFGTDICYSASTNLGQSWSPYERISDVSGSSYTPWISQNNSKLHVVWWQESFLR